MIDHDDVIAIATEIATLIADKPSTPRLVDAATLAKLLSVSIDYIYANSQRLGGIKLDTGPRAPLRFDPHDALERLKAASTPTDTTAPTTATPRRRSRRESSIELLPIRGANRT